MFPVRRVSDPHKWCDPAPPPPRSQLTQKWANDDISFTDSLSFTGPVNVQTRTHTHVHTGLDARRRLLVPAQKRGQRVTAMNHLDDLQVKWLVS